MPNIQDIIANILGTAGGVARKGAGVFEDATRDLGRINVAGPRPAQAAPPQVSSEGLGSLFAPQPTPTPTPASVPQPQPQQGGGIPPQILAMIAQLAIPAVTAGVGLGVKGALPGAAGFATGFEAERVRGEEDEAEKDRDVFVLGDDGKPEKIGSIPRNAILRSRGLSQEDLIKILSGKITKPESRVGESLDQKQPVSIENAPSAKNVPDGKLLKQNGKVIAIAKDGVWVSQ